MRMSSWKMNRNKSQAQKMDHGGEMVRGRKMKTVDLRENEMVDPTKM